MVGKTHQKDHLAAWKNGSSKEHSGWNFEIYILKIHMDPNNGDLEDEFPVQLGWFLGSMLSFRGVYPENDRVECEISFWDMMTLY